MKEQNTNYAYKLKYLDNPTFDKVRDLAVKFMRELPRILQNELYDELNHGVDLLDSEPLMETYLYSFGKMHQAKLQYAFDKLPDEFLQQDEINIIDYGCGQALGTMCYADFLNNNGYSQKVKNITLIEPSEMCLKRAALHVSVFFPNAEIKTVCKTFDDLDADDICCNEDIPTLHIFSNVLDILDFDLNGFSNLLDECLNGYNQFVCVGPYFNYSVKDERMEILCSLLNGNEYYSAFFDKYEFEDDKSWTCQINVFNVGARTQIRNNYEFEQNKRMAEEGDAIAQNHIGLCYLKGKGVSQDHEKAIFWFSKAAEQDYVVAQFNYGYCLQKGIGVTRDYTKAFHWFSKAANQGYASAQNELGHFYHSGIGISKDFDIAFEWFSKAAEQGVAEAQLNMGDCYYYGEGTSKDLKKAAFWYSKAADQGYDAAQWSLGRCYELGEGVIKDVNKANELYSKAKEQGLLCIVRF